MADGYPFSLKQAKILAHSAGQVCHFIVKHLQTDPKYQDVMAGVDDNTSDTNPTTQLTRAQTYGVILTWFFYKTALDSLRHSQPSQVSSQINWASYRGEVRDSLSTYLMVPALQIDHMLIYNGRHALLDEALDAWLAQLQGNSTILT